MEKILSLDIEYQYLVAVSLLLLLPKLLLRFRVPSGISAMLLGVFCVNFLGWFNDDQLILTLARLGITSLFLYAGMEIEITDLKNNLKPLLKSVFQTLGLIMITAVIISFAVNLSFQISLIISIAIFTPSAGFILSSLKNYELTEEEIFWIKLKAISKEISAIFALFVALQMNDIEGLIKSNVIFVGLVIILPYIFKFYLKYIAPHAIKGEVSFLVLIAFVTGVFTKKLGTHYLVGAFITGVIAGQFHHFMKSEHSKRIEDSLSAFYTIFVPFYFFSAGLIITKSFFTVEGLKYGILISLLFIPLRIIMVSLGIKYFKKGFWKDHLKISISLVPNLIFGLVIIGILKDKYNVDASILSALVIYTVLASIIPAVYFKKLPTESFDLTRSS
jgi:Kef-type K+ transport system membrane component KefB